MTRRGLFAPALGLLAAACSPLSLLNTLGPRDHGVRRVARDLAYGDDPRQRMDVYAPKGGGPYPTLVFFYGGGWDSGSRDLYGWAAQALTAQGFVVALPDYRLVPQVVFPAFIEDAAAATAKAADLPPTGAEKASSSGPRPRRYLAALGPPEACSARRRGTFVVMPV